MTVIMSREIFLKHDTHKNAKREEKNIIACHAVFIRLTAEGHCTMPKN